VFVKSDTFSDDKPNPGYFQADCCNSKEMRFAPVRAPGGSFLSVTDIPSQMGGIIK
jgi:hypothetical protein